MGAQSTDLDLLARWARQGDAEAFNEIAVRHAGMVYSVCRRILRDATEAEDVAQECFEKLVQSSDAPREQLGGWLHSVAVSRSLNRLRARQRRAERETRYAAETEQADAKWDDLYAHVDEALAALPEAMRTPIVLHFFEGRTHDAIALELGLTRSGVTRRIERGVERLRKTLRGKGVVVTSAAALTAGMKGMAVAEAAPAGVLAATARLALAGPAAPVGVTVQIGIRSISSTQKAVGAAILLAMTTAGLWLTLHGRDVKGGIEDRAAIDNGVRPAPHAEMAGVQGTGESQSQALPVAPAAQTALAPQPDVDILISGIVVDAENKPVEGATVRGSTRWALEQNQTKSARDGSFRLSGITLPSAEFYLVARKPGLANKEIGPVTLRSEGLRDIVLTMLPESVIVGKVVDEKGHSIADCGVLASAVPREANSIPSNPTNDAGEFVLGELHAGTYRLLLSGPAKRSPGAVHYDFSDNEAACVDLNEGEHRTGVTLTLVEREGLTLTGRVTNLRGEPLKDANIRVGDSSGVREETNADGNGNYRITGLSEGTYDVTVTQSGYDPAHLDEVEAGSGGIDFKLTDEPKNQHPSVTKTTLASAVSAKGPSILGSPATIRGRVIRDDTKQPITEFTVRVVPGEQDTPTDQPGAKSRSATKTLSALFITREVRDNGGRFEVNNVSMKNVTVFIVVPGFGLGRAVLSDLPPGQTAPDIEIALGPETQVRGVTRSSKGEVISGVRIYVGQIPVDDNRERFFNASSGRDGIFELRGLPAGPTVFGAYHPDYAPATISVDIKARTLNQVEILLIHGGAVEGVLTVGGQPAASQMIAVHYPEARAIGEVNVTTNEQGRFRFDHLAPGELEVSLWYFRERGRSGTPDHLVRTPTVVEDGKTTTVDFELPAE